MSRNLAVYGIGNAIMDLQVQVNDSDFRALGLRKGTMQLVELVEQQALLDSLSGLSPFCASGGSAANSIITLALLGAKVGYGCLVGKDEFGKRYLKEMADLGVKISNPPLSDAVTGTSVIIITNDAERTMNTHLGVSATFNEKHIDAELIKSSEWLYIEGYLFSSPGGRSAVDFAISIAKQNQVKVAISCSDTFIVSVFGNSLRQALAQADLVFLNQSEAAALTERQEEEEIVKSLKSDFPGFALTLGEAGARIWFNEKELRITSPSVQAIDTTGAGDTFAGGFLFGLTQGLPLSQTGELACRLAAQVVAKLGPRLSAASLEEQSIASLIKR